MNIKRFTASTSRQALAMVRHAFGEDAVVLSTRPGADGVEVLAMAPEGMQQLEAVADQATLVRVPVAALAPVSAPKAMPAQASRPAGPSLRAPTVSVDDDVDTLGMSTLTFQDYVRDRMLKRRQTELSQAEPARTADAKPAPRIGATPRRDVPVLRDEVRPIDVEQQRAAKANAATHAATLASRQREHSEMLGEMRAMKGLIEERFGMLAFMEKLQRQPRRPSWRRSCWTPACRPRWCARSCKAYPMK